MRARSAWMLGVVLACTPSYSSEQPASDGDGGATDASNIGDAGSIDAGDAAGVTSSAYFMRTLNRSAADFAVASADGFPTGNAAMTMELWFRAKLPVSCSPVGDAAIGYCTLVAYATGGGGVYYMQRILGINASHRLMASDIGDTVPNASTTPVAALHSIEDGLWHHIAVVIEPVTSDAAMPLARYKLFMDGDADVVGNMVTQTGVTNAKLVIGGLAYGSGGGVTGDYADVRVWSRALDVSELAFYKNRRRAPDAPGLLAYYDMTLLSGARIENGPTQLVPNKSATGNRYDAFTNGESTNAIASPQFDIGGLDLLLR